MAAEGAMLTVKQRRCRYARGPRGEKRPADVIGRAVQIMRIATGEEPDDRQDAPSPAAQLGKLGGAARARKLTPERRAEIAREGAAKRWAKSQD